MVLHDGSQQGPDSTTHIHNHFHTIPIVGIGDLLMFVATKFRKRSIEGLSVFGVLLCVLPKRFTVYVLSRR